MDQKVKTVNHAMVVDKTLASIYIPPMAGVTDLVFRRIVRHVVGDDLLPYIRLSTEMISSKGIMYQNNPHRMRLEPDEVGKTVIQLFGHEPDTMAKAALLAEKAGAESIDINMGCPVPKITNGKDGAALMKEPCLAVDIVKEVVKAVNIPVSVKTRLGWDDKNRNARDLALRLEDAGIHCITIHGRTRSQAYTGTADWHSIKNIREELTIPVFANGDIDSPDRAIECQQLTNAHGIAIARACIGNPWIIKNIALKMLGRIEEIQDPSLEEKIKILKMHMDMSYEDQGERGVQALKKHLGKYVNGFQDASKWRSAMATSQSYESMSNVLKDLQSTL